MTQGEAIQLLTIAGPIVAGSATIVAAIHWLMRRHARKLGKAEARIKRLEREREDAVQRSLEIERLIESLTANNARLQQETETLGQRAESNRQEAEKFLAAGRAEYQKRKATEARAKSAEAMAKSERLAAEKAAEDAEIAVEAAKKQTKELEAALETASKQIAQVANQDGRVWQAPLRMPPPEFVPLGKRKTRIISILNLKGGVGKTTLTANLGGYLANCHEKSVLLLDLDHQRSLTQLLLPTAKRKAAAIALRTVQDFLLSERNGEELRRAAEQLQGQGFERCWLIGNSDAELGLGTRQNLDDLEMKLLGKWLVNPSGVDVRFLMRPGLHSSVVQQGYDYVLIDCPPRLTTACINALAASDFVLIPAQAEHISARSVPHLLRRLRELHDAGVLPDLQILGIVANMVSASADSSTSLEAKILNEIASAATEIWGRPIEVLKSKIRESDFYATCQRESEERLRLPAVAVEAIRRQYGKLTKEIEDRIHESLGVTGVLA